MRVAIVTDGNQSGRDALVNSNFTTTKILRAAGALGLLSNGARAAAALRGVWAFGTPSLELGVRSGACSTTVDPHPVEDCRRLFGPTQ